MDQLGEHLWRRAIPREWLVVAGLITQLGMFVPLAGLDVRRRHIFYLAIRLATFTLHKLWFGGRP